LYLGQLLPLGPSGELAPGRAEVVQIPVLQRKSETRAVGASLAEDRQTLSTAPLQPVQATPVNLRVLTGRDNNVMQDRALSRRGQIFEESQVGFDVPRDWGDVNEAVIPLVQHFRQVENILIAHGVGHHRRAVVVSLSRIPAEPLNGKATQARVHTLVQEP